MPQPSGKAPHGLGHAISQFHALFCFPDHEPVAEAQQKSFRRHPETPGSRSFHRHALIGHTFPSALSLKYQDEQLSVDKIAFW